MNFETLKFEQRGFLGILKISREKAMNALNDQVIGELSEFTDQVVELDLRCLILTGEGPKSFVAGADIKEMQNMGIEDAKQLSIAGQNAFNKIEALPFPTIAAVNGFALGGGFELALSCDFIIASEKAKFGLPEVGLGLIPGYGGTQRLSRTIGLNHARRMTLSGEMFKASALYDYGAVSEVVAPEQLMERCEQIAGEICKKGPKALALCKESIRDGYQKNQEEGLAIEAEKFSQTFATQDRAEGVSAFIEKRAPEFSGQ